VQLVPLAVSDSTLGSALGLKPDQARERALAVLDATRRAGGASALLWHNTSFSDGGASGYGSVWEDLLDTLIERGAHLGPIRPPAPAPGARLDGRKVLHVTSVHRPRDVRIFHKETAAARQAGADAHVLGLETPVTRGKRIFAGWGLVRQAAKSGADVFHFHDPELLPASLWLAKRTGKPVIYDLHEYLGGTVRTKRWLPPAIRRPLAVVAERAEFAMASRLPGIVGSNEDLAARFAVRGQRATVVTNAPWSSSFPVPPPATEPIVLYVGGLSPIRGLTLMKDAFACVTHPGARLLLVGPGDPGELADNVEWLGVVDHSEVAGLVARAAISWVPLQYNGNYQKIVPTKLIEAMASARPVVTSNFGRMAQIAGAAQCGLLVPPDDPQAHAAAIDRLLGDPELAATMGRAGRDAFERAWTFERQADRLTSFYDELLREGR
jgi:glycosyltransferase involved in cell wall biosynthesis